MYCKEAGMVIAARELQFLNALSFISLTPSGITIDARFEQFSKALSPIIEVTVDGNVIVLREEQPLKTRLLIVVKCEPGAKVTDDKEEQPLKVSSARVVTPAGIVIDGRWSQPEKASF